MRSTSFIILLSASVDMAYAKIKDLAKLPDTRGGHRGRPYSRTGQSLISAGPLDQLQHPQ